MHTTCLTLLIIPEFINLIIFGEKYKCTAHSEVIHTVSNITTQNVSSIYSYFRFKFNYNYSQYQRLYSAVKRVWRLRAVFKVVSSISVARQRYAV
jgi:hypothetical protein